MAAAELTSWRPVRGLASAETGPRAAHRRPDLRAIFTCWLALDAVTALGAVAAIVWPALGPATGPHATLHPSAGAAASIVLNNLRVLAAPFILVAARFERARGSRLAGDAIVAAILVGNAVAVGLALGRWRGALVPFVPQLPIEYLAAATAAAAWLGARSRARPYGPRIAVLNVAATIALTATAAAIEVLLTPHAL
jgi:hypothetical protein